MWPIWCNHGITSPHMFEFDLLETLNFIYNNELTSSFEFFDMNIMITLQRTNLTSTYKIPC
jgi:hypothetical protein